MSDFSPPYPIVFENVPGSHVVSGEELANLLFGSDGRFRLTSEVEPDQARVTGVVLDVGLVTRATYDAITDGLDHLQLARVTEELPRGGAAVSAQIIVALERQVSLAEYPEVFDAASRVLTGELAHGGVRDPLAWIPAGRYKLPRITITRGQALSVDALLDPEWAKRGRLPYREPTSIAALGLREAGERVPCWKLLRIASEWKRSGRVVLGQALDDALEGRTLDSYAQPRALIETIIDELARTLPEYDPRELGILFMPSVHESDEVDLEMHELRFLAHDAVMRHRRVLGEELR